ncbi:YihY/virulence factor BrkB family protein [Lysinibacillus sp. BW-2-10]|uniref:YihY/virulence factor BrkB family protein n=1 Tax=Lysinibacillus sp. BW-2-10 TaxID=2590030 RepID=UPI00117F1486|nr:YihY/virulence factor BrkB family protein [Lysinibacillus sp. BW-2-10]TSI10638.1 YihY/virulence factor BrkB family protein [Lysinibacillus sp. BW-2-10]
MQEQKKASQNEVLSIVNTFIDPDVSKIDVTTVKGFFQDLIIRMRDVDISGMGAQLAYFFLLSFFPLLIFIVTLVPYLDLKEEHVFDFIQTIMPAEVFMLTQGTLTEILTTHNGGGLLGIGIVGTIWSASRGVNALIKTLNHTYDTEEKSGIINRGWSLVFTIALVVVILLALLVPIFGQRYGYELFSYLGVEETFSQVWKYISWVLPPTLIFIVLALMYWIIPNTDPRLHLISVIPGALFSTVSWVILIYAFSYYVNNFGNFTSTYGSIAGVIILMLWLYFTGMILIFGGLLNASLQKRKLVKMRKRKHA